MNNPGINLIEKQNVRNLTGPEKLIIEEKYDEAAAVLLQDLEADPDNARTLNSYGLVCWYRCNYGTAYSFFEKAVNNCESSEDFLINYFDAGLKTGNTDAVLKKLEEAALRNPGFQEVSKCLLQLKRLREEGIEPDFKKTVIHREFNRKGEKLINEGMFEKAAEIFRAVLEEDPQCYEAWNNLGLTEFYSGHIDTAVDYFRKCFSICPAYTDSVHNMFDAGIVAKDLEGFMPLLQEALALDPGNKELKDLMERIREKGDSIFEEDPFTRDEKINMLISEGDLLVKQGKPEQGLEKYFRVIGMEDYNYRALNGIAVVCYNNHEYENAYKLLKKAAEINPLSEMVLINFYEACLKLNLHEEAVVRINNALETDPSLYELKEFINAEDRKAS
ncbi:MAG: tetratricopeptide repeat protein [Fibrobacterota bacterium]